MRYLDSGKIIVDNLDELREIVKAKEIDLALIDIKESNLTTLNVLFYDIKEINGDISDWDISNITALDNTFYDSKIQPDLSKWNTSKVTNFNWCFQGSKFNGDISNWDLSSCIESYSMFYKSQFNGDISKWDMSNNKDLKWMFAYCNFDGDISDWKLNKDVYCDNIISGNEAFENKYNTSNIENNSKGFFFWFEENKALIKSLNITQEDKDSINDYLSNFNLPGVDK